MRYRIKIVPKAIPNADGDWLTVETDLASDTHWRDVATVLAPYVPETHFLVQTEMVQS